MRSINMKLTMYYHKLLKMLREALIHDLDSGILVIW